MTSLGFGSERDVGEQAHAAPFQPDAIASHQAFEQFIADLTTQVLNVPAEALDDTIRGALHEICVTAGVDRSSLQTLGSDGTFSTAVTWPEPDHAAPACRAMTRVPILVEGSVAGAVSVEAIEAEHGWPPEIEHRLPLLASVFGHALARRLRDDRLRRATTDVTRLTQQMHALSGRVEEPRDWAGSTRVIGQSPAMRRAMAQIQQVAATESTVLLLGETGTGKELLATQIHELGARRRRPMVRVNCAAIPSTLIESELFGREKGAFTGALARQVGRFELASRSTIFLDEIGDLPPDVQVKLLRVLEECRIERLGSPQSIAVDVRVIAATHQNLEERIAQGTFREDLFYRLNVFPIRVPPLRERAEDVPLLVWRFVEEFSTGLGKRVDAIPKENLIALQHYAWPGNVRELRNAVERAMIAASGPRLTIAVPRSAGVPIRGRAKLIDVERDHIRAILESTGWRIRGTGGAAERLGLKPTTLETRMAKLGLRRPGRT